MGRPRKNPNVAGRQSFTTCDPQPSNRDPALAVVQSEDVRVCQQRKRRRYIPANMPTVCPTCGGNTRMANGRHVDQIRCTILEYRTCANCGANLAAGRPMTEYEKQELCVRVDAVREYEETLRS
jgi:hypothetical protein